MVNRGWSRWWDRPGSVRPRLVGEAAAALVTAHPDLTVLRGRCVPAGQANTYGPLADIVRDACGISMSDPLELARTKCEDGLRAILGRDGSSTGADAVMFALAATCGIRLPGSNLDRLEPRAVADELARAWPRFLTDCSTAGPVLVLLEGLHWAGPELVEMLELMTARATGPALLLATARPEVADNQPGLGAGPQDFASISLRPLTGVHSTALLDQLTGPRPLAPQLRAQVLAKAEGNPFFLEELVLHLDRETETSAPADRPLLPDSLHALLAARIDALSPAEKSVLLRAAVVGRVFWREPVERALGAGPVKSGPVESGLVEPELVESGLAESGLVESGLRTLESRGFVLRRPLSTLAGQVEYAFRHALIHDVAYAAVPKLDRPRAHAEVGDWLEGLTPERRTPPERRAEIVELLAYHFGAAATSAGIEPATAESVRVRAFDYLIQAGTAARGRSAVTTALRLHDQARGLAVTDQEKLQILEGLGDDNDAGYRGDAATDWYGQALAIARGHADYTADRARLCRKIAWLMTAAPSAFRVSPDPAVAERYVVEGRAAAFDEVGRAWLLVVRGMSARLWRGSEPFGQGSNPDPVPVGERIRDVERALAAARTVGVPDLISRGLNHAVGAVRDRRPLPPGHGAGHRGRPRPSQDRIEPRSVGGAAQCGSRHDYHRRPLHRRARAGSPGPCAVRRRHQPASADACHLAGARGALPPRPVGRAVAGARRARRRVRARAGDRLPVRPGRPGDRRNRGHSDR
ncbi:MAG: hypothetical protein L0Y54_17335 [Sporichthyaceae bacterium]|nr:hypothetical protein [Sporichthyaceae bacterium]